MKKTDWILLITLSFLWGGAYIFVKIAVQEVPVFTLVTVRTGIAALVLWPLILFKRKRKKLTLKTIGQLFVLGFLNSALPFSLISWSQTGITSGLAAILTAATPLYGILLAHWMTRDEKLTSYRLIGVLIGIAGVVILVGEDSGGLGGGLVYKLAVLGGSCSYALAGIYSKRFKSAGLDSMTVSTVQLSLAFLLLLPITFLVDKPLTLPLPGARVIGAAIGVSVLSTGLAFTLFYKIVASAGAGNALMVTMMIPFVSVGLGVPVFGDPVKPVQMIALVILITGLLIVDGRIKLKRKWKPKDI